MKVVFKPTAYRKLRAYVMGIDYEISGFGRVEKIGENLVVTDIKIFQQIVTEAHTVMDAGALAQFFDDLITSGEDPGKWKLWWHSHVEMPAHFSQTDYNTIDDFDAEMPEENWMLSIVTNKFGKSFCRADIFQPIRCTISDIPWDIDLTEAAEAVDVAQEILEKVTIRSVRKQKDEDVISWFGPRQIPLMKNGKMLTPQERMSMLRRYHNIWPPQLPEHSSTSTETIEGEILDAQGNPIQQPQD
jgi:hypothetical protein